MNEAKDLLVEDHNKTKIASTNNEIDFNDVMLGDDIVNSTNTSNMKLDLMLPEIDNYGEEFLCCGKSSIKLDEHTCESYCVSNNVIDFTVD